MMMMMMMVMMIIIITIIIIIIIIIIISIIISIIIITPTTTTTIIPPPPIYVCLWMYQPWRFGTSPTLIHLINCCPAVSNHYLNQCWLIIWSIFRYSPSHKILKISSLHMRLNITNSKLHLHLTWADEYTAFQINSFVFDLLPIYPFIII